MNNSNTSIPSSVTMLAHVLLTTLFIGLMYFLKEVLIPLALAIYLSFLLFPFFKWLHRRGLPRKLAVVTVVIATLSLVGSGCWVISAQLSNLASELPDYTKNITRRLEVLNEMTTGSGRWKHLVNETSRVISGKEGSRSNPATSAADKSQEPTPVVLKEETPRWMTWISGNAGSALVFIGELALALVLVIFILLNREDLLNRVLRLAGIKRIWLTSKVVSETGERISRFLLVQFIVNCTFGILLTISLLLLGLNYALLWGFLTAVLRYMPYVGPWVSAIFPFILSLAQFDSWWQPMVVLGVFLTLEITISNFVEPFLYGQSIGVSEVALLLAAAFWGWMWGIVGLVLSAPLTVVIVVLGKYVTELHYLTVLLSDQPALSRDISIYQRLLAGDQDEAEHQVKKRLSEPEPEKLFDEMLVPALSHLKVDLLRRRVDQEDYQDVLNLMNDLLEEVPGKYEIDPLEKGEASSLANERISVLGYAVRDVADHMALTMFDKLLDSDKWDYELAPADTLSSEIIAKLKEREHAALCLGTLQPGGTLHLRHLCKKMRLVFPDLKILVAILGPDVINADKVKLFNQYGADWVGNTMEGVDEMLSVWYPIWKEKANRQVA